MINTTSSYKVNYVKKSAKGNTKFSIGDYNKEKPEETRYYSVVAFNSIVLQDGDCITIDQIKTVGSNDYKDKNGNLKTAVTICGIVKQSVSPDKKPSPAPTQEAPKISDPAIPPYADNRNQYDPIFDEGPLIDIDADDLPF